MIISHNNIGGIFQESKRLFVYSRALDRRIKGFPVRVVRPPVPIFGLCTPRSWTLCNKLKVECDLKHDATLKLELSRTLDLTPKHCFIYFVEYAYETSARQLIKRYKTASISFQVKQSDKIVLITTRITKYLSTCMESYHGLKTDRGPGLINCENNAEMGLWAMLKNKCFENRRLRRDRLRVNLTEGIFYQSVKNVQQKLWPLEYLVDFYENIWFESCGCCSIQFLDLNDDTF